MSKKVVDRMRFRVWDVERERYWLDGCYISQKGEIVTTACDDGCCLELDGNEMIEQCTGLKDKNGKFIYEGDILCYNGDLESCKEVCWSPTLAGFMADDYAYDEDGEYCGGGNLETIDIDGAEIVGNIHDGIRK